MHQRILSNASKTSVDYLHQLRSFQKNARLFLVNVIIIGAAMGIFRLLFNFYLLSLGYDNALVGNLITASSLAALVAALPMGYLADILGRKTALLLSTAVSALSIAAMVVFPNPGILYLMNILSGLSQSLGAVAMAPFLMENSGESERVYLFSISAGLQMVSVSVGSWLGGYLPSWMGIWLGTESTSAEAYGVSLLLVAAVAFFSLIPLLFISSQPFRHTEKAIFAPLSYATQQPVLLGKLLLPTLITSIGAGLILPFMNVFFREVYGQPDSTIGVLFAWGSLSMAIGLLVAPPLAKKMGKIQLVVITQALSIPFLFLLGFSPWFWLSAVAYYVRVALMNMSNPIYQTFVMERVDPQARSTVASLVSMSWNFGWAFSPTISGWLQVQYGFSLPFLGTILLYTISVFLYWAFFWRRTVAPSSVQNATEAHT
jgi:MFS family permease